MKLEFLQTYMKYAPRILVVQTGQQGKEGREAGERKVR